MKYHVSLSSLLKVGNLVDVATKESGFANALNQWGGAQQGRSIGLWTVGDPNNPLAFVSPNEMSYPDYKVVGIEGFTPENKLTLWYDKPATLTSVELSTTARLAQRKTTAACSTSPTPQAR